MAVHSLSIAKASFLASCLRPDPRKLSRDELLQFHTLLETSIFQCTPSNIQSTKEWLWENVLPSATRTAAFSKYLASLSKNIDHLINEDRQTRLCRRQLHLLYFLNDIFHHAKYHTKDQALRKHVKEHIPPILPNLIARAAEEKKSQTSQRLKALLDIWEREKYCEVGQIASLKEILSSGKVKDSDNNQSSQVNASKELPWILPATHGDPNAPYFDLPAANLMPHIVPNSTKPMRPDKIRALQLPAGPADESLINAVKDFLKDVDSIDDPFAALEDEGIVADIDDMGQISYKNEADDIVGDTYYGWSRAFCDKMKSRSKDNRNNGRDRSRSSSNSRSRLRDYSQSRSRSRSHSRSHSRSPRKRRRYSSSRSRSSSPRHRESPPRFTSKSQRPSFPKKTSSSRSYSPDPPKFSNSPQGQHHFQPQPPPPLPLGPNLSNPGLQPPAFVPSQHGSPPPRPPNWQGPWPPLPPPPSGNFPNMSYPPPPPPSHSHGHRGYGKR